MKMVLDDASGLNLISACDAEQVKIRGRQHPTPLLVLPRAIEAEWPAANIEALDSRALRGVAAHKPELLILGTGSRQQFPEPRVFIPLMDAGIGYEVMDNMAACRTYNILLSEGREVALLLLGD